MENHKYYQYVFKEENPDGVTVCKHMHVRRHVCMIIQWEEEFTLPLEIKAINAAQDAQEVKSSAYTVVRAASQRGLGTHQYLDSWSTEFTFKEMREERDCILSSGVLLY